jgi:hypothetical protein
MQSPHFRSFFLKVPFHAGIKRARARNWRKIKKIEKLIFGA